MRCAYHKSTVRDKLVGINGCVQPSASTGAHFKSSTSWISAVAKRVYVSSLLEFVVLVPTGTPFAPSPYSYQRHVKSSYSKAECSRRSAQLASFSSVAFILGNTGPFPASASSVLRRYVFTIYLPGRRCSLSVTYYIVVSYFFLSVSASRLVLPAHCMSKP